MSYTMVCMGCGLPVDASGDEPGPSCSCAPSAAPPLRLPPPSVIRPDGHASGPPSSGPASGPYRAPESVATCPRCHGRMTDLELHDIVGLECTRCLGLFLDADTVKRLTSEEGHDLRFALPRRERVHEPPVQYLPCVVCGRQMNRINFAKISGVIIDVCRKHGIWFDAGEINAIIDFVEHGGMARSERRDAEHKAEEHRKQVIERREIEMQPNRYYTGYGNRPTTFWRGTDIDFFLGLFD